MFLLALFIIFFGYSLIYPIYYIVANINDKLYLNLIVAMIFTLFFSSIYLFYICYSIFFYKKFFIVCSDYDLLEINTIVYKKILFLIFIFELANIIIFSTLLGLYYSQNQIAIPIEIIILCITFIIRHIIIWIGN